MLHGIGDNDDRQFAQRQLVESFRTKASTTTKTAIVGKTDSDRAARSVGGFHSFQDRHNQKMGAVEGRSDR